MVGCGSRRDEALIFFGGEKNQRGTPDERKGSGGRKGKPQKKEKSVN